MCLENQNERTKFENILSDVLLIMRYSTKGLELLGKCHDENIIIDAGSKFGFAGRLFGGS